MPDFGTAAGRNLWMEEAAARALFPCPAPPRLLLRFDSRCPKMSEALRGAVPPRPRSHILRRAHGPARGPRCRTGYPRGWLTVFSPTSGQTKRTPTTRIPRGTGSSATTSAATSRRPVIASLHFFASGSCQFMHQCLTNRAQTRVPRLLHARALQCAAGACFLSVCCRLHDSICAQCRTNAVRTLEPLVLPSACRRLTALPLTPASSPFVRTSPSSSTSSRAARRRSAACCTGTAATAATASRPAPQATCKGTPARCFLA